MQRESGMSVLSCYRTMACSELIKKLIHTENMQGEKKKKAGGHTSRCVAAILYGPPLLFGFGQNSVL